MNPSGPSPEPMKLTSARQWLNRNSAIVLVLCVAAMGLSVMILRAAQAPDYSPPSHEWYFDSVTGELLAMPVGTIPMAGSEGNDLWRAHVYACGDCDGQPFTAYYTRWSAEARQRMQRMREAREQWMQSARERQRAGSDDREERPFRDGPPRRFGPGPGPGPGGESDGDFSGRTFDGYGYEEGMMRGLEYSTDGVTWTAASFDRLDELQEELTARCPGDDLRPCVPPRQP